MSQLSARGCGVRQHAAARMASQLALAQLAAVEGFPTRQANCASRSARMPVRGAWTAWLALHLALYRAQ